jgi:hypothetical protein
MLAPNASSAVMVYHTLMQSIPMHTLWYNEQVYVTCEPVSRLIQG